MKTKITKGLFRGTSFVPYNFKLTILILCQNLSCEPRLNNCFQKFKIQLVQNFCIAGFLYKQSTNCVFYSSHSKKEKRWLISIDLSQFYHSKYLNINSRSLSGIPAMNNNLQHVHSQHPIYLNERSSLVCKNILFSDIKVRTQRLVYVIGKLSNQAFCKISWYTSCYTVILLFQEQPISE